MQAAVRGGQQKLGTRRASRGALPEPSRHPAANPQCPQRAFPAGKTSSRGAASKSSLKKLKEEVRLVTD